MKRPLHSLIISLTLLSFMSCNDDRGKLFTALSHRRTGIEFRNWIKESETFNVLDYGYLYNGAGVAVGDVNNDGLPDIYFSGNFAPGKLYLNKGNFRFEDITDKAGATGGDTWNTGVTMADINGDGFLDIYVCSSTDRRPERRKNLLYINNGNLTFTESAAKYGIDDHSYSTHSVFFDYDKDGDLDLFLLNHSLDQFALRANAERKKEHDPRFEHKLYKNSGGRFLDANKETGMITNIMNFGLGIAVADFNNDNWPDIYICNDYSEQDYLYINQQNGTFSEQLEKYFDHVSFSSMGNDAADFNNDGYIDLITLDMLPEDNYEQKLVAGPDNYDKFSILKNSGFYHQSTRNMLQLNNHGSFFTEIGQYAGVFSTNWSWAPLFCDFDNDGNKDLYITNGYGRNSTNMDAVMASVNQVRKQQKGEAMTPIMGIIEKIPATVLKNYIYKNNGDLTFSNVSDSWGDEVPSLSNGAAYGDFDNDGDMDLVVSTINDYPLIYRNNSSKLNKNHFLKIKFDGIGLNKGGIGAKVEIACKDEIYMQEFMPSRGYMSSMNHELIFGVGKATVIDSLKIIWPDMREQILTAVGVDQTITLYNTDAKTAPPETVPEYQPIFVPLNNKILDFKHVENEYVDFRNQILLPHFLSTQGPHIAKGDINNDGLEDLYMGGAKGSAGKLFIQNKNGSFKLQVQSCLEMDKECEDIGALFFDADGDKDLDLYVVSGGNEFPPESPELRDRLYLNNGSGLFTKIADRLPVMLTSGSCVKAGDIDNDGDADLFVGGRLVPESYPFAPRSYILENNGKGHFKDITELYNKSLMNPGMVTDAVWTDFNGDRRLDLIIVGEWMGIRVFQHDGKRLTEITDQSGLKDSEGWWNTIMAEDFDRDGDMDYVLGNLGLNSQIKASVTEPATMYAKDFDNNGSIDAIMCYFNLGRSYPFYAKDDMQNQLPFIKKKYPSYKSYASQTIHDIFPAEELKDALQLKAGVFASCYLENKGNNRFSLSPLPPAAQLSPIYAIQTGDYNEDGNPDMILAGNFYGTRIKFGAYDANKGLLLAGNGKGSFTALSDLQSGFQFRGEVRDMADVRLASGKKILIFSLNNDSVRLYGITKKNRITQ